MRNAKTYQKAAGRSRILVDPSRSTRTSEAFKSHNGERRLTLGVLIRPAPPANPHQAPTYDRVGNDEGYVGPQNDPFSPFVITTEDGVSTIISNPRKALIGNHMLAIADDAGRLHHISFASITDIGEPTTCHQKRHVSRMCRLNRKIATSLLFNWTFGNKSASENATTPK